MANIVTRSHDDCKGFRNRHGEISDVVLRRPYGATFTRLVGSVSIVPKVRS